jgi:hypothetical protein
MASMDSQSLDLTYTDWLVRGGTKTAPPNSSRSDDDEDGAGQMEDEA